METIKIDKNIHIPTKKRMNSKKLYLTFENMEVGDSFVIPIIGEKESLVRSRLYATARNFKLYKGVNWTFTTRVIDNKIRIWRIS